MYLNKKSEKFTLSNLFKGMLAETKAFVKSEKYSFLLFEHFSMNETLFANEDDIDGWNEDIESL